jgi:hypothetical protein
MKMRRLIDIATSPHGRERISEAEMSIQQMMLIAQRKSPGSGEDYIAHAMAVDTLAHLKRLAPMALPAIFEAIDRTIRADDGWEPGLGIDAHHVIEALFAFYGTDADAWAAAAGYESP